MDEILFLGLSIWSFAQDRNVMNFCLPGFCADPIDFDYQLTSNSICLFDTEQEIEGCYDLVARDGQLDWIDETGTPATTVFTAFHGNDYDQFGVAFEHFNQEMTLRFEQAQEKRILTGLRSLGLLDALPEKGFDASVRRAIVELQRRNGIFPSGFVDEASFRVILGHDPLGPALEPGELTAQAAGGGTTSATPPDCFQSPSIDCLLDLALESANAKEPRRESALFDVVELFGFAGKFEEGLELANTFEDETQRQDALERLSRGLSAAGMFTDARSIARSIEGAAARASALRQVASKLAEADDTEIASEVLQDALKELDQIGGSDERFDALIYSAEVQTRLEMMDAARASLAQAYAIAMEFADVADKSSALVRVARMQVEADENEQAGRIVEEVLAIATTIEAPRDRAIRLVDVARLLVQTGFVDRAVSVLEDARKVVGQIESKVYRGSATMEIVEVFAEVGMAGEAMATIETIERESYRGYALRSAVGALARAGLVEKAQEFADRIEDREDRAYAYWLITMTLVRAGKAEQAMPLITAALELAQGLSVEERATRMAYIAGVQAEAGMRDEALASLEIALKAARQFRTDKERLWWPMHVITEVWIELAR
ncbi:tetratricopeptide repeat protein [Albidovulum sediminicola]|uniref:Peptidoglycan binding-like domain-containing protein n=1 Tax=Albidovulum sediminicola TaxID=2984331 RepID=A0ABT2Z765_9RHOB|nr:hypothetical protein [Defluviimonas sp. WL0075]MCV2866982.1 hypothetical protein [Defluviimonas sp. WL0075]